MTATHDHYHNGEDAEDDHDSSLSVSGSLQDAI